MPESHGYFSNQIISTGSISDLIEERKSLRNTVKASNARIKEINKSINSRRVLEKKYWGV